MIFGVKLLNDARQILLRPTRGQRNLDKIGGTESAITRLVWEISANCLRLTGSFRGRPIEWRQTNSTATNPRCRGKEIWYKIGDKLACIRDIREMFAYNRWFSGSRYWLTPDKSYRDQPLCHGNEIWDKIGNNSAYIKHITEIFAYNMGFSGSRYWLTPDKSYRDQPLLPWQRNLGEKWQ